MTHTCMTPGQYKIQENRQGQVTIIRDSIVVKKGQNLVLSFIFNEPCLYIPLITFPICPKNYTDSIIPVIYGLIATGGDTFIKQKDLKVKYAGCVMTRCDPQLYCKEHNIEF